MIFKNQSGDGNINQQWVEAAIKKVVSDAAQMKPMMFVINTFLEKKGLLIYPDGDQWFLQDKNTDFTSHSYFNLAVALQEAFERYEQR